MTLQEQVQFGSFNYFLLDQKPGQAGVVKILLRGKNQRGEVVLEITRELAVLKREFRP